VGVVVGATFPRQTALRITIGLAVVAAFAVAIIVDDDLVVRFAAVVVAAAVVLGFAALPSSSTSLAITKAREAEQARADAEVLGLLSDAAAFRRVARHDDDDDDGTLRDVGSAVVQRDRLYRLLGLIERGLRDVDGVALYVLDDRGTHLRLVEQCHRFVDADGDGDNDAGDVDNHALLALGARGVGPAGLLGLAVQRKGPLRVVDVEGAAVRAHRRVGPPPTSAMCVPLLAAGGTAATGVLIVDRVAPVAFTADDEAFVRAAAAEVVDGLASEALFEDLDHERRRSARVFAAARALAGVTRASDVPKTAATAIGELCAGVAIVDTDGDGHWRVGHATGVLAALDGRSGLLEPTSFSARALIEQAPLPHTALDNASPRPLLADDDGVGSGSIGDVRVVPLLAAGIAYGVVIVATRPGEKLRKDTVAAVVATADVLALALSSARAFDAVEKKATTDALTGVWNRRSLEEKLSDAVARAKRSKAPLCVMITDVDHFKSVNDTWGHATGDEVLKGVAKSLQAQARGTDVVARLGGDEFVVVCEATDLAGAAVVAERMRLALKALQFSTPKGPLSVTSSFGVALLLPD
ncbi:MAG TPA: sensor domain-containing diguanylate cyclase, partial [Myxococcota bacterium]